VDKFQADPVEFENWLSRVDLTQPNVLYGPYELLPLQKLMLIKILKPYEFLQNADTLTKRYFTYITGSTLADVLNEATNRTPVCLIV
jgi:hypothetical protein